MKAFSVASWNVEHFKDDPARIKRIVGFLSKQKPDILALYEVEGKDVYSALMQQMPTYQFHITEGSQTQEILVGVKRTMTSFFTQRLEYKTGNTYLRPGALLSVRVAGKDYSILFLHTKSSTKPVGLGLRDEMFERAFAFKKTLDKISPNGQANYLFLGDLNTMGMLYPFERAITWEYELKKLDREAKKRRMRRLPKTCKTWWNGAKKYAPGSDLDQVVAADHLTFKKFNGSELVIRGWPELSKPADQLKWIKDFSDHALLYFVVNRV